jgi:hypothetical protein
MTRQPMGLRALLVGTMVAASVAVFVPAPTVSAASCLRTTSPPAPPPRGAVLWSPLQDGTEGNTLVLNFEDVFEGGGDCDATIDHPWAIAVAPGGALAFIGTQDFNTQIFAAWGAVNVPAGTGPINLMPSGAAVWNGTEEVSVYAPAGVLGDFASCRNCDLSNATVALARI